MYGIVFAIGFYRVEPLLTTLKTLLRGKDLVIEILQLFFRLGKFCFRRLKTLLRL
jgi:hypothetical protein